MEERDMIRSREGGSDNLCQQIASGAWSELSTGTIRGLEMESSVMLRGRVQLTRGIVSDTNMQGRWRGNEQGLQLEPEANS